MYRTRELMDWYDGLGLDCSHHAPDEPPGYIDRSDWFREKGKTHQQFVCPQCGLWKIWLPKESLLREDVRP
jgi:hypothetical protein